MGGKDPAVSPDRMCRGHLGLGGEGGIAEQSRRRLRSVEGQKDISETEAL